MLDRRASVSVPAFGQDIPFAFTASPGIPRAREHNVGWLRSHGMLGSEQALAWYAEWDIAKLAGYTFPYAIGDALDLGADLMAVFFLFDDQFDGELGRQPGKAAEACERMAAVVLAPAPPPPQAPPLVRAFTDLWRRSTHGMPTGWRIRTACHFEEYLAAQASGALDRQRGVVPDRECYLSLRRLAAGTQPTVDMCERIGGFHVPAAAFHSPQLRIMREIATDAIFFCNDVYSCDKEEQRGDVDNIVTVIVRERRCSRRRALEAVGELLAERLDRFTRLERQLDRICWQLQLAPAQRAAVLSYAKAMKAWVVGNARWSAETARYHPGNHPAGQPGYAELLL
jgi:pentalenene synthase/avermitilol synthase